MSEIEEKYIGSAELSKEIDKRFRLVLKDASIGTKHLKDGSVTVEKLSSDFISDLVETLADRILAELINKAILNRFGNNTNKTISQKLLTDTINDIYSQLRDIKGEPPVGLYLTATPEYFIGEEGANVHIEAVSTSGVFEYVAFFVDDVMIPGAEAENVYRFAFDTTIDDTVIIKCNATIMGTDYTVEKKITHYSSFWLGAGANYTDIMDTSHTIPIEGSTIRGAYDITANEGDHIIIIVGDTLRPGFIRADLNGFEIPFTTSKITVAGNDYWVFTSENMYHEGTYNIDING